MCWILLEFKIDEQFDGNDFSDLFELQGKNILKPSEYLNAQRKNGN